MVLKNLFTGQQWREKGDDQKGQETNGDVLCGSGNSNRGSVSTWRGGMGRGIRREGIYVYLWLIHAEV